MACEVVAIGASLGGLEALQSLLGQLDHAPEGRDATLMAAILVVQHRRAENNSRLTELLQSATHLSVVEASDHQAFHGGHVYLAPPDYHLLVEPGTLHLSTEAPVNYARPSIDVLFETTAEAFGDKAVAVVLTGASDDGAAGAAKIVARGGKLVVQDPKTAVSPVAPLAAMKRTQPHYMGTPADIGRFITHLCSTAVRSNPPKKE